MLIADQKYLFGLAGESKLSGENRTPEMIILCGCVLVRLCTALSIRFINHRFSRHGSDISCEQVTGSGGVSGSAGGASAAFSRSVPSAAGGGWSSDVETCVSSVGDLGCGWTGCVSAAGTVTGVSLSLSEEEGAIARELVCGEELCRYG